MVSRKSYAFETISQTPNLTTGLIDTLVAQIESGNLAPGQRLPTEQAIVDATGVSRTVVREALASLKARGLIRTRQGLGAFVAANRPARSFTISPDDLRSIDEVLRLLELRMGVEVEAAGLAAQRRSEADIDRMQGHLDALEASISAAGSGADEDFAFHRAVLVATQNPYFARFFDSFGSLIIPRQRVRLDALNPAERRQYLRRIQREHMAILTAILDGNAEAAQQAARNHLAKSYARYRGLGHAADENEDGAKRTQNSLTGE
jgi:DNA-binding FadR family transcriptional regulator